MCPTCNREIKKSFRYCHRCGANIRLRQRSFEEPVEIKKSDRETVRSLSVILRHLVHIPILFEEHQDYLAGLHMLMHDIQEQIDYWQNKYETYEQQINSLESFSITAIMAKLLRRKDKMVKSATQRLETADMKLQIFNLQKNDLTTKLEMAYEDTTLIENLLDKKNQIDQVLNDIMSKNSDGIIVDQIEEINSKITKKKTELIEIGTTYNRLQLATNYLMHASKILDQMEKQELEPVGVPQILEEQSSITNLETDKVNTRNYAISLVWTKLLAMYIYGDRLGSLTIVIPRAGTLSMGSYFSDIFPEEYEFDLEWIDNYSDTIIALVQAKSNYLSGMIDRVRKKYDDLLQEIDDMYNNITKLQLQQVE